MGDFLEKRGGFLKGERGLVGIGILIVFIAMVILSAVSAGVLINTATTLQGQARATSSMAMTQAASGVRVLSVNGTAASVGGDTRIDNVKVLLKLRPGSDSINLKEMSVEYVSEEAQILLSPAENSYSSEEDFEESGTTLGENEFAIVNLRNSSGTENFTLSTMGDIAEVIIDVESIVGGLSSAEKVRVALIPKIGFKTYASGRAPAAMKSGGAYKIRL